MYKAIIFDFFDVLRTDAYKAWLRTNNIPHEGAYFEASHQQDLGIISGDEFLQKLSDLHGRKVTREELDENASVDMEVVHIAESLKKHYKIALVSNAPSEFIRQLLQAHDLARLFDEIVVSSEVSMVKPSKEIFDLILSRLKVAPSEAVFIDDNPGHVEAARKNGIKSIRFVSAQQLILDLDAAGLKTV